MEKEAASPYVLVVGSTTEDTVVQGERTTRKPGGVTTYAGLTYRRLGWPVVVVTNVADAALCAAMERSGIRCACGPSPDTTRFVNVVDGAARRQLMPSQAAPLTAAQVRPWLDGAVLVHLGPLHPDDLATGVYALPWPAPVALDVQGLVRRVVGARVAPVVSEHLGTALAPVAFLKAGAEELALMLETPGCTLPELMARFGLREVVVTEGPSGGYVAGPSGGRIPYAAPPAGGVADPTGAGDVFFAAYLAARVLAGLPVAEAAHRAATTAARHVEGRWL